MTDAEREVIIAVLEGLALADHLGDVRNEEEALWNLIGVPELPDDADEAFYDSPYRYARARLHAAGLRPPYDPDE